MSRLTSLKLTALAVVALAAATGCTALKVSKPNVWPFASEDSPQTPTRMVASWTDTILYQPNQVPTRGFGGRIMFYAPDKPEPVKVDGTLTVYVFDETNRDPNNEKPDRKCVFTKDQLPLHYSKSKLGHSYSVWVPWDEMGGPQKEFSLIVRFTPDKGGVVIGEQAKQLLPGKTQIVSKNPSGGTPPPAQSPAWPAQTTSAQNSSVQPVSYVTPLPPIDSRSQDGKPNAANQSPSVEATTIPLPQQSSLRNSLMMHGASIPNSSNPSLQPPAAEPRTDARSAASSAPTPAPASTGLIQPARYQTFNTPVRPGIALSTIFQPGTQPAQPLSQSNRFALGQPQVPGVPVLQPTRDLGQWQQPPSGPQCYPDTMPQSTTTANGLIPSSSRADSIQN